MSVLDTMVPREDEARTRPRGIATVRDEDPDAGVVESIGAGFRTAADEIPFVQESRLNEAYAPLVEALTEVNGRKPSDYAAKWTLNPLDHGLWDAAAIERDLLAARVRNPKLFPEFKSRMEFERDVLRRHGGRDVDEARLARGNTVGALIGGVGAQVFDPFNMGMAIATGGAGTYASLGRTVLAQSGIGMATEATMLPGYIGAKDALGEDVTAGDAALQVGAAGLFGGAVPIVARGAKPVAGFLADKAAGLVPFDVQAARALGRASPAEVTDMELAQAFDAALPGHLRTQDEAAAGHVLRREAEVDGVSPYVVSHAGADRHRARIAAETQRMIEGAAPRRPVPAFETAWRAIIGIEGGVNRDGSFRTSPAGAIGPAQVMPGTAPEAARLAGLPWDERRYRTDPAYNIALGQAYYREMLRQFDGDPVKAAAAYNAGPGSARKGRGVRGAIARAEAAGRAGDWVEFLPAETRGYVAQFRRRTGMGGGDAIAVEGAGGAVARAVELDDDGGAIDVAIGRANAAAAERWRMDEDEAASPIELPQLRRDLFADDEQWRVAQAESDADVLGLAEPVVVRDDSRVFATVPQDAAGDGLLGPASVLNFLPQRGEPGVSVISDGGDFATAVFRDAAGVPQGAVQMPMSREAMDLNPEVLSYVRPEFRRQGVATRLYDALGEAGHPIDALSGAGDLTPMGADFVNARRQRAAARRPVSPEPGSPRQIDVVTPDARSPAPVAAIGDDRAARFDDPAGAEARLQAEGLSHDVRYAAEAGELDGMRFAIGEGVESAGRVVARLDADDAALAALRGCL